MAMTGIRRTALAGGLGVAAVLCLPGLASADTFNGGLIQNGSFESPALASGYTVYPAGSMAITDWTVGQGSVQSMGSVEQDSSGTWPADTGSVSVDLSGNSPGDIYQAFPTTVGTTYTVTFALGGNFYCNGQTAPDGNPIGPLKTAVVSWEGAGQPQVASEVFNTSSSSPSNMNFRHVSLMFVANSPKTTLDFADASAPQSGCGAVIDSVAVNAVPLAATPEAPLAVGLPAAGVALLGAGYAIMRRRRTA